MDMLRPIRRWRRLSWGERELLVESILCLAISYVLVRLVPFRYLARALGNSDVESSYDNAPSDAARIAGVINGLHWRFSSDVTCLMEGIAGKIMLNRRKIPNTLYLGVIMQKASEMDETDSKIKAHAWLRSGTLIVTGREGYKRFKPIAKYSNDLSNGVRAE